MKDMLTYRQALTHYGIDVDPFSAGLAQDALIDTDDIQRARSAVLRTAIERTITIITAPAGSGKTTVLGDVARTLARKADTLIITPSVLEIENLKIRQIESAILDEINGQETTLPRDAGRRGRLLEKTMGQSGLRLLLVIDEAHLLNISTFRSLKRLWNLSWKGISPLLGICLIGQPDLRRKVESIWELEGRSEHVVLHGLTVEEAGEYIRRRMELVDRTALWTEEAITELTEAMGARTPLHLNRGARAAIEHAYISGKDQVDAESAQKAAGRAQSMWHRLQAYGITAVDIARQAGVTRQQAWKHLKGHSAGQVSSQKQKTIDEACLAALAEFEAA